MKCRHCGMDSRTAQSCEWCHKPLSDQPQAAPASGSPPQPVLGGVPLPTPSLTSPLNLPDVGPGGRQGAPLSGGQTGAAPPLNAVYTPPPLTSPRSDSSIPPGHSVRPQDLTQPISPLNVPPAVPPSTTPRVSLTGEAVVTPEAAEPTLIGSVPTGNMPGAVGAPGATMMGAPPPIQTPYGLPVAAMTPHILRDTDRLLKPVRSWGESFELFLAMALPLLLGSLWLVHVLPATLMWVSIGDTVLLSLLMGVTGAIPAFDDAYTDVAVTLVVTFLFGPLIALVIHLVVGAIKQEWNGAVIGLLALNLLLSYGLMMAAITSGTLSVQSLLMLGIMSSMIMGLLRLVNVFFAFGAWMVSGFFRPFEAT